MTDLQMAEIIFRTILCLLGTAGILGIGYSILWGIRKIVQGWK